MTQTDEEHKAKRKERTSTSEYKAKRKNVAWCGLMTSTKRSYLEKLLQNTINELVIWKNLDFFIKQLDERARTCRECGSKYSEIPIDKGKYAGDNEPQVFNYSQIIEASFKKYAI